MKKITLWIIALFCSFVCLQAQEVEDSVSSKRVKPVRRFEKFVKKFIDFNNYDTAYITPNKYNFTIMLTNNTIFEHYRLSGSGTKKQRMEFAPNPSYKVGAYFGWRWIFFGWTTDAAETFGGHNKHKSKKTELTLNLYSSKLGIDFYYWKIGNDFKLEHLKGFDTSIADGAGNYPTSFSFNGLEAQIKGFNGYYIFNNKHFSYPAAFSQSTNQRKSAGSLLVGIAYSRHKMTFDYTKLPAWIQNQMDESLKVNKVRYSDFSIHLGYAYNWVFLRNCLACISLTPAAAYKSSDFHSQYVENSEKHHTINFDFITRAALVYNNAKYFAGASLVAHTYEYKQSSFNLTNTLGTLQLYAGFYFGKK